MLTTAHHSEQTIFSTLWGFDFKKDDFIEHLEECPICGSHDRIVTSSLKNNIFQYLTCNNCCAISASHYAKDDVLTRFYATFYEINPLFKGVGVTHDSVNLFAKHI